LFLFP